MPLVCGFTIPMDCNICYETTITEPCANNTINFQLNLTPGNQYYLWVIDKFKNVWRDQITVQSDGSINITISDYPNGLFNKNAGIFKIFLSTDLSGLNVVNFTINSVSYSCYIFGFSTISQGGWVPPVNTQTIIPANNGYYVYDGTTWILIAPNTNAEVFYATAGQTVINTVNNLDEFPLVFLNKIVQATGWTKTGDNQITFITPLNSNDQIIIKN